MQLSVLHWFLQNSLGFPSRFQVLNEKKWEVMTKYNIIRAQLEVLAKSFPLLWYPTIKLSFCFFHFSLLNSKFESVFFSAFFLIVLIFVMILHESKMWHVKYEEINNDWDCSNQMTKVILSLAVGSTWQSSLTCTGILTWKKNNII